MKNFQTKSIDSDHKGRELQAPSVTEYMTPKSKLIFMVQHIIMNRQVKEW